jgi:hypothetical protein
LGGGGDADDAEDAGEDAAENGANVDGHGKMDEDDAAGDGSDGMGDLGEENDSDGWHTDEDAP